jgi:hypothetical protein
MLPVGDEDEPLNAFAFDEGGKPAGLAPGSERSGGDGLACGAAGAKVDEKVPEPGRGRRNKIHEATVARKAEARKASPFEAPHAEHEATGNALPEKPHPEALPRFASREHEDRIGLSVEHFGRMIAWG